MPSSRIGSPSRSPGAAVIERPAVNSDVVHARRVLSSLCVAISLLGGLHHTPRRRDAKALPASAPKLDWKRCGDGSECAKLTVPLDYEHPDNGKTMRVALLRVRATDREQRIGSLLINPGGPGAPGTKFARDFASALPDELQERFDIVGFDPRGTGDTHPVMCRDNLDNIFSLDYSPDTPEERASLDTSLQQLAQDCEQRSADVLPYVSSENTARDMDRIRQAVGDKGLTYVGYSYGSYIGTLYARLFPKKVRALVFDGAIDPNLSGIEIGVEQATSFERSLDEFLAQCSRNNRCPFYNAGDSADGFDRLAAQVDAQPLPTGRGRTLGPGEFYSGVWQPLYTGEEGYAQLEQALAAAQRGDGTRLLALSDQYTRRRADGTYASTHRHSGPSGAGTGRAPAVRMRTWSPNPSSVPPRLASG